ncbi:MAG: MFS transporter [Deltaproteobacteria bacterium]|jgi:NNP family nitrate/nitrite transporter-like MFS transporter|nr:MFS transporter [Deltaproteobacteria bacterium]
MTALPTEKFREALPWVLLLSFMFCVNYTDRALLGPLLVYIESDLGLSHSTAAGLLLYMSVGFTISTALSSFVAAKIAPVRIIAFSAFGCGLSLLAMSMAGDLVTLTTCVFGLGVMSGLYMTSAIATMGTLIQPQLWTKSLALHELAPPISLVITPLLAEAGVALYNACIASPELGSLLPGANALAESARFASAWRGAALLLGVASLAAGVFFLLLGKGGQIKTNPPSWAGVKEAVRSPLLWFFTWCFTLAVTGEFAPYNVLSLCLTYEWGLAPDDANKLLALTRLASPFAILAGGFLAPKLGISRTIKIFFILQGLTLVLMGMPVFEIALIGMFAQPLLPPFAFPTVFTIVTTKFDLKQQPLLFGIAIPLSSCIGLGLMPKLLGVFGDLWSFSAGFVVLGLIHVLGMPFCRMLEERKGNEKQF